MKKFILTSFLLTTYLLIVVLINTYGNEDILSVFLSLSLLIPILYLLNDRFKQKQTIAQLKEESLKAELGLLKSQINPHFFFNTLNNLYGLAVEKSDLTAEVIAKLADMMRFTIYDGRRESVAVHDEIDYLNNFITIHMIRFQQTVDIKFNPTIADETQRIPPLLFINLLENAFKHGAESLTDHAFIRMKLNTTKESISFEIENNFEEVPSKKRGIGVENLKRRLDLLFPEKHTYTVETKQNIYKVKINIDLI